MNKIVVKSLKSLALAGALTVGGTVFGGQVSAAEQPNAVVALVGGVLAPVTGTVTAITGTSASVSSSVIPAQPPVMTGTPAQKDPSIKSETKSSLLNVGVSSSILKPITGDVNVDVLNSKKVVTDKGTLETGGVVQADLKGSKILGDTHAGVIENTHIKTKDYEYTHSAVADVDIKKSIIGDAHAGVIEHEKVVTSKYSWDHSGVVIVDTKGTPILGNVHAGVLENENYTAKPGNSTKPSDNGNKVIATPVTKIISGGIDSNVPSSQALPKTGSAIDSFLLLLASVMMVAGGMVLRKINTKRV